MKNTLLLVSLLVIATSVYAQDHKFQVGIIATPEISHRFASGNSIGGVNNAYLPKFGYTAGVNFVYNFTQNIGLETGLQLTNKGYKTDKLVFLDNISLPQGTINGYSIRYFNYYYLALPFKMNFIFGQKKVRFIGSVGIDTWIFLRTTRKTTKFEDDKLTSVSVSTPSGISNPINISPIFSAGVDVKLTNSLNLKIEPTFRFGLLNFRNTNTSSEKLISAGLNLGLYYGF